MSSSFVICLSLFAGPLIAGLAAYVVLSYLFVPIRMTVPLAITISVLILGLSKYYAANNNNKDKHIEKEITITNNTTSKSISETMSSFDDIELKQQVQQTRQQEIDRKEDNYNADKRYHIISETVNYNYALTRFANLSSVIGYAACLLVVTAYFFIFNPSNEEVFVPWEQFTIVHIIGLGTSIALCFFLPGYALLEVLFRDSHHKIRPLLKFLLAYLLSLLITGLIGYIAASAGIGISDIIGFFIAVYSSILIVRIIQISSSCRNQKIGAKYFLKNLSPKMRTFETIKRRVWDFTKRNSAKFTVFASIFALVILSTYFLYLGAIIGDQWYHHGRSLPFMSGDFRDMSLAGADEKTFSPFPSALLASFFSVSGIPSVNAYASISFLNIMPVLAFYYFFKNWVPIRMKKAALLACTLFMLSSGFGWVYVLDMAANNPPESQLSALEMLYQAGIKSNDIILPTSFVGGAHPDFSTPLIIMALPAGFTMLGLLKEEITKSKLRLKYFAILLSITLLGIISHDEFYLFIIIASIIPFFLFFGTSSGYKKEKNYTVVYAALLTALLLTVVLAIYSFAGIGYFTYMTIVGIPLVLLCFVFVAVMCVSYTVIRFFYSRFYQDKHNDSHNHFRSLSFLQAWGRHLNDTWHKMTVPCLAFVGIIAWLYALTFVVWAEMSVEAVDAQTHDYTIPWYLYPMKLGLTGLLGIAFILSYLFRKFEKEIFLFGIIVVVAFVTGPYYDEHRFSKYMMAGLAGLGSLFIYDVVIKGNNRFRILVTSLALGIVILSSALSVMMFWAYNASAHDSDFDKALGRRDFPSESELDLFSLLRNGGNDPLAFNIAAPANEYAFHKADLIGKVHAFSGIPWIKLTQSPLTLNASTLESFYDLLHQSDTRYIVLPKKDLINLKTEPGIDEETEIRYEDKQETDRQERSEGDTTISGERRSTMITGILRFAVDNFKKIHEDSKYLVLAVPNINSPQSQADIGLIHKKSELLAPSTDNDAVITLPYDKDAFKKIDSLIKSSKVKNEEKNVAILYGNSRTELWSYLSELQQQQRNVNYIESTFRIIGQNKSKNDAGIMWDDGNREYTVLLRNDRLETVLQSADNRNSRNSDDERLIYAREITRENGAWYTIKIMIMGETVNVYVNNLLAFQIPKHDGYSSAPELYRRPVGSIMNADSSSSLNNDTTIHKVGIFSFNNVAEFKPIRVGEVTPEADRNQNTYFRHYYPLSMLALSKINYDTFLYGDMSALSKKFVILSLDSLLPSFGNDANDTFSRNNYLKFVNDGGTLVIMNIDDIDNKNNHFLTDTEFGKLFTIQGENKFDSITYEAQGSQQDRNKEKEKEESASKDQRKHEADEQTTQYLNVSGIASDIEIRNTSAASDMAIKSYYVSDDNQKVAPFAIEKKYGMGRLIFVNNGGYFDAVAKSPQQAFLTLEKSLNLIGFKTGFNRNSTDNHIAKWKSGGVIPIARLDGDLKIQGNTKINSSSFSIVPGNAYTGGSNSHIDDKFYVQGVMYYTLDYKSISRNGSNTISKFYDLEKENHRNDDTLIEDLRLSGPYEVIINTNGSLMLPSSLESYYNYVGTSVPAGSDIILKLHKGAIAEFAAANDTGRKLFKFNNGGEIHFYNLSESASRTDVSILLKNPEIRVANGKINFEKLYYIDPSNLTKLASNNRQLEVNGKMVALLNNVDNYHQTNSKGTKIDAKTLSYFRSLEIEQDRVEEKTEKMDLNLKLPADISEFAKEKGISVPWQKTLFSNKGLVVSVSMFIATVIAIIVAILLRPQRLRK